MNAGYTPERIAELVARYANEDEREWFEGTVSAVVAERRPALMEFIPATTPGLSAPRHLKAMVDWIEQAILHMGTPSLGLEAVVSTPPQHGKTTVLLHVLVWLMKYLPFRHIYCTYSLPRAQKMSKEFERIAQRAGLDLDGNLGSWTNPATGAEILFAAVGGGATTGAPCDGLFLVDDPFAGLAEARSAKYREAADVWYQGTATTRMHPGSSKLIVATRWDVDDLSGRKVKAGWPLINLPAFLDGVRELHPLWPEGRPREFLLKQKASMRASVWAALFLGEPVRDESRVFGDINHYIELPKDMRIAIGVDLAYTRKTSADTSVAVVLGEYDSRWYVIEVVRRQVTADKFATELQRLQLKYPGAPTRWYVSTTEVGTADVIRKAMNVPIYGFPTVGDKLVRATPASLAWGRGHILLPDVKATKANGTTPKFDAPWYDDFARVVTNFTGNDDPEDDDVDALAAAFDQLAPSPVPLKPKEGTPEWAAAETKRLREEARQRVLKREREDEWQSISTISIASSRCVESTASAVSRSRGPASRSLSRSRRREHLQRESRQRRPSLPARKPARKVLLLRSFRGCAPAAMTSGSSTRKRAA